VRKSGTILAAQLLNDMPYWNIVVTVAFVIMELEPAPCRRVHQPLANGEKQSMHRQSKATENPYGMPTVTS
jgi:hypothetical protein